MRSLFRLMGLPWWRSGGCLGFRGVAMWFEGKTNRVLEVAVGNSYDFEKVSCVTITLAEYQAILIIRWCRVVMSKITRRNRIPSTDLRALPSPAHPRPTKTINKQDLGPTGQPTISLPLPHRFPTIGHVPGKYRLNPRRSVPWKTGFGCP
jgi:hypothetical protein